MSSPGRKTRILFPKPSLAECHASCSAACFFYELCPPPPLPAPAPLLEIPSDSSSSSSENPDSTTVRIHSSSHLVPVLPIAASALAASLLLIFLAVFALLHLRRRRRRRFALRSLVQSRNFDNEGFDGGDHGIIDHHVWYIRTTGLDQSAIEAITAIEYRAADGIIGAGVSDCAVCLGEFQDGELLRLLPKCGHAFHIGCIDTWLRSHVNCPLCRAPVLIPRIGSSRGGGNEANLPPPVTESGLGERESDGQVVEMGIRSERMEIGIENGILIGRVRGVEESEAMPIHRSASMNSIPFVFFVDGGSNKSDFKDEGDNKNDRNQGNGQKGHTRAKSSVFPL